MVINLVGKQVGKTPKDKEKLGKKKPVYGDFDRREYDENSL